MNNLSGSAYHPKVARVWSDYTSSIPIKYLEDNEELYGEISQASLVNPVMNTRWDFLFFEDSSVFRPAAIAFEQSERDVKGTGLDPQYTSALPGTRQYLEYWKEQKRRCREGYEPEIDGVPCGVRITGEHYFYLNFCRIMKLYKDPVTGEDTERAGFPDFLAMDYYWFLELERSENPSLYGYPATDKKHLLMAKARRKGWSFKNAAGAVWKYSFYKESRTVIVAEEGLKAKRTFDMCLDIIDFLNQYTEFRSPWTNRRSNEQHCYIRAGVETEVNGRKFVKGRKSIIETVTLHNADDKAAGLGGSRILFEEAGMIKKLKIAWAFTRPVLKQGKMLKGIAIVFGTGGDMDGATQDFSEMFYAPDAYGFQSYRNIYEKNDTEGECGWFVSDMWYREGAFITIDDIRYEAVDKQGNSLLWVAEIDLNLERRASKKKTQDAINTDITQYCKTPSEAFLIIEGSFFPAAELFERKTKLIANDYHRLLGVNGELVETANGVIFKVDMDGKLEPVVKYRNPGKNLEGCVVQYEPPQCINGGSIPPEGAYIISIDPIGLDDGGGESLIAIYVFKTKKYAHLIGHDEIVMSYVGRPKYDPMDTGSFIAYKMAKYYNARVTHENDRAGSAVRKFFIEKKAFHLLLHPPADIIEKHIPHSKTNARKSGHSMANDDLKQVGELYTKRWLLQKRGLNPETGLDERNLDKIPCLGLIDELIAYNRTGNFDRVMAFMGCVLQSEQLYHMMTKESETMEEQTNWWVQRAYALPSMPAGMKMKHLMDRYERDKLAQA